MRKRSAAVAVAAASIAMTLGAPIAAQANTAKEMKICWTAPKGSSNYSIKVVLDGPTSRSKTLKSGECKSWNVRPGDYKVVWATLDGLYREFQDARYNSHSFEEFTARTNAICGTPPMDHTWNYITPKAYVKRFQNDYVTEEVSYKGFVSTTVQNDRQTKVNFRMGCQLSNFIE